MAGHPALYRPAPARLRPRAHQSRRPKHLREDEGRPEPRSDPHEPLGRAVLHVIKLTLPSLLDDAPNIADNLRGYIARFSSGAEQARVQEWPSPEKTGVGRQGIEP